MRIHDATLKLRACRAGKEGQVRAPWKTEIVGWPVQSIAGSRVPGVIWFLHY